MRFIFSSVAFSLLTLGCSHIQYVGSDKQQNIVSLQGGQYDTESDVEVAAEKYCPKPLFTSMETKKETAEQTNPSDNSVQLPQYIYNFKCESAPQSQN